MNWEAIGAIGELVGAAGVIVTLGYLAIQIRENSQSVRASTFHEAIRDQVAAMEALNHDSELNRIWYDGMHDFDALSKEDQRRFATYLTSVLRRSENLLYQTRQGRLDADAWAGPRDHLRWAFSQPGTVVWWKRAKNLFDPHVVTFVERELL